MRISDWSSDVCSSDLTGSDGIAGSSTTARWNVTADFGHCRGSVSTGTCDYGFARNRITAFSSPLLLSARRAFPYRDVAGDDRRPHRFCPQAHRPPPPLASPGPIGQGADPPPEPDH